MGDIIVDEAERILSEADIEPKCPKCGSRKMFISYSREFTVNLDEETSEEAMDSGIDPYNITCYECGEPLWED